MLGSGFFVGLKVTYNAMVRTGAAFLEDANFYDFAASSTVGYTQEEVSAILADPGVLAAEGANKVDALVGGFGEEEVVLSFLTYTRTVNEPSLSEGRSPLGPEELVLDTRYQNYVPLGSRLTLSEKNEAETLEAFAAREFTVVGYAASPLYLNYERGNTSVGSGSVTAFVYVDGSAFTADYFTTVYLRTSSASAYSAAYDEDTDRAEPAITALAERQAKERLADLMAEARKELREGEEAYDAAWQEYSDKKEDAQAELEAAEQKLADAKQELEDGKRQLEEGKAELETRRAQGRAELDKAKRDLAAGLAELEQGERDYEAGKETLEAGRSEYESGLAAYNAGKAARDSLLTVSDGSAALLEALGENVREPSDNTLGRLATRFYHEIESPLRENYGENHRLMLALEGFSRSIETYNGMVDTWNEAKENGTPLTGILAIALRVERGLAALGTALRDFFNALSAQLQESEAALAEAGAQLEAARLELESGEAELAAARKKLDDGWAEYAQGKSDYEAGERTYAQGIAQAEAELQEAERKLTSGQTEYDDGLAQFVTAKSEYETNIADAEAELGEARQKLDDAQRELDRVEAPQVFVLGRWANVGYSCFESDASIVSNVARVFPAFFFLVAALICMTTVSRMVDEQRAQLGVLMALGYSRLAVMAKYLLYAGSASVLGAGLGILLFSWLFPNIIWQAYSIMYDFTPRLVFTLNVPLSVATFCGYVGAMLLVTWLSLRKELKDLPANIIRPKPPKAGKRVLLERIPFVWNSLDFMRKVTVRNIFRYKSRVAMMALGIGGCTALMITGFGIQDSIQNVVDYQYSEITVYNYDVTFMDPPTESARAAFAERVSAYADGVAFASLESVDAAFGKSAKSAYLTLFAEESQAGRYFVLSRKGEPVPYPGAGEAVVNSGLAEDLGLGLGDELTVTTEEGELRLKVSGIFDNYIYNYVFIAQETYAAETGHAPDWRTALILQAGEEDLTGRLLGEEGVVNVTASSVLRERIGGIMDSLIYIVLLTIVCAAALAFIVIYNLTNININERMREIATVKVLGFYPLEAALYVLRENLLLTVLGALVGIPLGIALNTFVVGAIKVDLVTFTPRILPTSFAISVALTLVFSLAVDVVMARKLNRIDMAAALKAAE